MNQHVGDQRLLKLAEFLKTVPPKQFDYSVFVGDDWKGATDLSCGTKACALGWATTMPEFRRLGLRMKKVSGGGGYVGLARQRSDDSFEIAAKLFDISLSDATNLFAPSFGDENAPGYNATPKQVAKHIERFVKDRQKARAAR